MTAPAFSTVLKNMASSGGGQYFQVKSANALDTALKNILDQIQAVNSVFSSASLPVSVSVRGTFLNQVYLGVFRPDAFAKPNWVGNLKQFKLGVNSLVNPPTLFLADRNGDPAENPTTGFVNPNAVSFWTQPSTFWDPLYYVNSQGIGGTSDSPDGDLVEKGGASQYIRRTFLASQAARKLYTCTGLCAEGTTLSATPFDSSNPALTASALSPPSTLISTTEAADIINWVRGGNVNLDDPANSSGSKNAVRGFSHGDVLHSRPAVINYNRNPDDIVVYYGANDGILHAVKGGQVDTNGDGNELWGFIAPEHFKQFKRMRAALRTLRTRVGRVRRDVERQIEKLPTQAQAQARDLLHRTGRILSQRAGNPYDGHTLAETVQQVSVLTDCKPTTVIVDKGYRGVAVEGVRILMSGQRCGITKTLKAMIKRRSAIEPAIGHMKMDGRLARNPLKGALGDALHAVMCGAGHNLRLILAKLRLLCAPFGMTLQRILGLLGVPPHATRASAG